MQEKYLENATFGIMGTRVGVQHTVLESFFHEQRFHRRQYASISNHLKVRKL